MKGPAELAAHGITHETTGYYVAVTPNSYTVYRPSPSSTHAVPDSSYPRTDDGHSLAVARCEYLARHA